MNLPGTILTAWGIISVVTVAAYCWCAHRITVFLDSERQDTSADIVRSPQDNPSSSTVVPITGKRRIAP